MGTQAPTTTQPPTTTQAPTTTTLAPYIEAPVSFTGTSYNTYKDDADGIGVIAWKALPRPFGLQKDPFGTDDSFFSTLDEFQENNDGSILTHYFGEDTEDWIAPVSVVFNPMDYSLCVSSNQFCVPLKWAFVGYNGDGTCDITKSWTELCTQDEQTASSVNEEIGCRVESEDPTTKYKCLGIQVIKHQEDPNDFKYAISKVRMVHFIRNPAL